MHQGLLWISILEMNAVSDVKRVVLWRECGQSLAAQLIANLEVTGGGLGSNLQGINPGRFVDPPKKFFLRFMVYGIGRLNQYSIFHDGNERCLY
jgi:hypothetical protein